MKYEDIKYFSQRCEEHPDHQSGMISNSMIQQRLHEEIDELREYIEQLQGEEHMNTCPNCGKVTGLHSSILQGCMCQYSMQAPAQRTEQEPPKYSFKAYWEKDGRIGVVACIERPDGGVHLMSEILDLPPSTEPQYTSEHQARIAAFKEAMRTTKEKNT